MMRFDGIAAGDTSDFVAGALLPFGRAGEQIERPRQRLGRCFVARREQRDKIIDNLFVVHLLAWFPDLQRATGGQAGRQSVQIAGAPPDNRENGLTHALGGATRAPLVWVRQPPRQVQQRIGQFPRRVADELLPFALDHLGFGRLTAGQHRTRDNGERQVDHRSVDALDVAALIRTPALNLLQRCL